MFSQPKNLAVISQSDLQDARTPHLAGHQNDSSWAGRLYHRFLEWFEKRTLRHADAVIVITERVIDQISPPVRREKITLIPSGHPFSRATLPSKVAARERLHLPQSMKLALYSGLSFGGKGTEILPEVAANLPPDCGLVVVGGEQTKRAELLTERDRLGLEGRLILIPPVRQDELTNYIAACDVGLLLYPPTIYLSELSSPLKLFEYLACGLPVVATDLPTLREIVTDGVEGVLISYREPRAIAEELGRILNDSAMLKRMSVSAAKHASQFHFTQRGRRILEVLTTISVENR